MTRGSVYGMHRGVAPVSACTCAHRLARGDGRRAAMQDRAVMFDRGQLGAHRACGHHDMAGECRATSRASAKAAPWLPEEWVTTPRAAVASSSDHTALQAPRNLNAPMRCRCSPLKARVAPDQSASSAREAQDRGDMRMRGDARGCGQDIVEAGMRREFVHRGC
jgi:hypothetical protein